MISSHDILIPDMWLYKPLPLSSYLLQSCGGHAPSHYPILHHIFPTKITTKKSYHHLTVQLRSAMASSTLSPITPSQLCSSKSALFAKPMMMRSSNLGYWGKDKRMKVSCMATSVPADDRVPDMGKRQLMNLLLLGALSLPTGFMVVPYASFFVPPGIGGGGGGIVAKDALGNDVFADAWIKNHSPGDRTLVQGLKGDPTYLVVENDRTLATYGINAVCTHLGCVVPWNAAENKFICPCHGSQYNNQGRVVRGPAPLSLALAHADIDDGKVVLVPWVETDFRTGEDPWWA